MASPDPDFAFEPAQLPAEAFRYSTYMARYGVTKAQAKKIVQRMKLERVFLSALYQANLTPFVAAAPFSSGVWISMKRRDKQPLLDRAALGRAMRVLLPGYHGYELFPASFRVVDTANQYHVWAFEGPGPFASCFAQVIEAQQDCEEAQIGGFDDQEQLQIRLLRAADPAAACDWRALQNLKERRFPQREAALYHAAQPGHPLEGWLICLTRAGAAFPFGFPRGVLCDQDGEGFDGHRQRSFGQASLD